MKRSLYEELRIRIDKEELAQLLGADPGFTVETVEEEKGEVVFLLSRETALVERPPNTQARESAGPMAEQKAFL